MRIKAKFLTRRIEDSGSDGAPDYQVYVFSEIIDEGGNNLPDKWIKETKLMKAVDFVKDRQYNIVLSRSPFSPDAINLPYPTEVSWGKEKVYMKNGNAIIKVDKLGNEKNLSEPIDGSSGTDNYIKGIFNKFMDGRLTVQLLEKANVRGVYFTVKYFDPQDKRVFYNTSYGKNAVQNTIIIEKETQKEIDDALEQIKQRTIKGEMIEKFEIITRILPPKQRSPPKK